MMPVKHNYLWCGEGVFDGKKRFTFGTVAAPDEREAQAELERLWCETFPIAPPAFTPIKGVLTFDKGEHLA